MDIALNFINNSNDANNSQIVIFQKNAAADVDEQPVAWKVIENCGRGDNHPFVLPLANEVTASDRQIWIRVVPQVQEGDVMDFAATSQVDTELSLLGIASADIVMTGGGRGANSTPFQFSLENVVTA